MSKLDCKSIEQLSRMFCLIEEIAAFLHINPEDILKDKEAMKAYNRGRMIAQIELRKKQMQLADRNTQMATWLGKQYLDQTDKQEIDHSATLKIIEVPERIRKKKRSKK